MEARFQPQDLCERLTGRTIVVIGDSVSHQIFEALFRLSGSPAPHSHGCYRLMCPDEDQQKSAVLCLIRVETFLLEPKILLDIPAGLDGATCPFPTVNYHGSQLEVKTVAGFNDWLKHSQLDANAIMELDYDAEDTTTQSEVINDHERLHNLPLEIPPSHLDELSERDVVIFNEFVWWGKEVYNSLVKCLERKGMGKRTARNLADEAFLLSYGDELSKMAVLFKGIPA